MEKQGLTIMPQANSALDCFCEESTESSCSSSYYSDSDSSDPEWEASVTSCGKLLYIDCDPTVSHKTNLQEPEHIDLSTKTTVRKSTRSKFLKLLHRRDSKRRSKYTNKTQEARTNVQDTVRVKFQEHDEGEIHEVLLKVNNPDNRQLGRRASLIESLLGLSVSTLLDGNRVMVAGFIPDSDAAKQSVIKIGDWLKSINNIDVNFQNLNNVLEQLSILSEVVLKLQRVAGIEVTKNPPNSELSNNSLFVQEILNETVHESISSRLRNMKVGILYISSEDFNENGFEGNSISYCYPSPFESNILYQTRGVFITLNHLLRNITQAELSTSSTAIDGQIVHIAYQTFDTKILYLMLPNAIASNLETTTILNGIVRVLKFTYLKVNECFETPSCKDELDKFFSRIFCNILYGDAQVNLSNCNEIMVQHNCNFESILPACKFLTLHEEAQIQIEDSLSELEASDYREWNEEPLDCQRLFTILGSALFHSGYLLATHLVHEDLIDVYLFCQHHSLFYLTQTEPIRSLVLWREVYPYSCNRDFEPGSSPFVAPKGKRFLLIVGKGKDFLAVLMEAGGCTEPPEENISPDPFYVEEAQATLEHLHELGIPDIAEHFILNHCWEVVSPQIPLKKRTDFLGNIPFSKPASLSAIKEIPALPKKKHEVTSILKHRSPDRMRFSSSSFSLHDDTSENQSEDSRSQSSYSETSEEPVLGRRAIREKKNAESDEESDIEDCRSSSNDLSDLKQSLLAETAEIKPTHLTAGVENVLFYYVYLDINEGLLICPPKLQSTSSTFKNVLKSFRICAQQIHNTFENTLRYKKILAQDMSKLVINKSLVAIKEQGMLFECGYDTDEASKKFGKLSYWVIGRLFYAPHPREVYICYQDTVPQNIIEIAFKLGVTSC